MVLEIGDNGNINACNSCNDANIITDDNNSRVPVIIKLSKSMIKQIWRRNKLLDDKDKNENESTLLLEKVQLLSN